MSQIIPFPSNGALQIPSYLKKAKADASAFASGVAPSFPVLSIKGKVFTLVRNQERKRITKVNEDGEEEAATALELVLLAANPNLTKVFYEGAFEEGSQEKPTCYSDNGVTPGSDSQKRQAKTCAACPHNVWGSGQNGKGKACQDNRRIAVAPAGRLDDPMLLRVPPASLKPLAEYAGEIDRHGIPLHGVVTKVRFDQDMATPKLMFSARGLLDEARFEQAEESSKSELVNQIIGMTRSAAPRAEADPEAVDEAVSGLTEGEVDELTESLSEAKAKSKPKTKPAPIADPDDEEEAPVPPPKVKAKAKSKPAAAPEPETYEDEEEEEEVNPKTKPKAKPAAADIDDEIDSLLSEFDD